MNRKAFFSGLIAAIFLGSTVIAGAGSAQAATKKHPVSICEGFKSCAKKGYSTRGYEAARNKSVWGAGLRQCTNLVAYKLTHNGRITAQPESLGNARDWGYNAPKSPGVKLYKTPKPGDVAWWSSRKGNKVSSHVAYVLKVSRNGDFVAINDNWNKTYAAVKFYKGGYKYPSGFLRFSKASASPTGRAVSTTTEQRGGNSSSLVRINSFHREADSKNGAYGVVSWGGARQAKGVVLQKTSRPISGGWYASRYFSDGKIPKVAYIYALNSSGTKGGDKLLGIVKLKGGQVEELKR